MANIFHTLFASGAEKELRRLEKTVDEVEALEPKYQSMSDQELANQTQVLRERLAGGETLDDILTDAFAVVREAVVRVHHKRLFRVQILGAIVLHQGRIAEMKTGEGKTWVAAPAAYLNALEGKGVHVVTVNDYLARFQGEMMGQVYNFLGMTVGLVVPQMPPAEKRQSYAADITYGTNNEYGFDYLRDNMVTRKEDQVQRPLRFAIIDEVDSILIDEARTPLIISGHGEKSTEIYDQADSFVSRLRPGEDADYIVDEKDRAVSLTEQGISKAEQFFGLENLGDMENTEINHHIQQALKAHALMLRDRDYIVQNDEVIIVDEFTGRLMIGRRFSEGLHQAIEAKEHVRVQRESKTLATITLQNYFRMYDKVAGMTGTAKTEEQEFKAIYGMDVVEIPTNRPMIRRDEIDIVYRSEKGKFEAVIEDIIEKHNAGRPVLVGTVSVEKSELLSRMLTQRGVPHNVLNAKHHAKEAEIVAQAGQAGAVTIATNMAGRGTDILLGGNPEFMARKELRQKGIEDAEIELAVGFSPTEDPHVLELRETYRTLLAKHSAVTDVEHEKVVALGGLHIIGTERHESRRIDNQLRGRSGRQGDPGSSRFYVALEDDIMRLFGSERIQGLVDRIGMDDTMPIEFKMLSKQIESAQKKVEGRNFDIRKNVLQYDDVMNQQRGIIYGQRRRVLEGEDVRDAIQDMISAVVDRAMGGYAAKNTPPEDWDLQGLFHDLGQIFLPEGTLQYTQEQVYALTPEKLKADILEAAQALYARKEEEITAQHVDMREVERVILLQNVDRHWMNHIDDMDQLRKGIGLRAIGQRDPVQEFKFESYDMFEAMVGSIQQDTVSQLYRVRVDRPVERRQVARPTQTSGPSDTSEGPARPVRSKPSEKIGRNAPCPCGSGKKYKNCCGRNA